MNKCKFSLFSILPGWFSGLVFPCMIKPVFRAAGSDPSGLVFAGGASGLMVYDQARFPILFPVFRAAGGLVGLVPILPGWWAGGGYTEKPRPAEGVP